MKQFFTTKTRSARRLLIALGLGLLPMTLAAVYVVLTPGEGITFFDEPPSPLALRPTSLLVSGDFPRYVVARERIADGANSPLLVFDSKLRAQAASENPPAGWQTIPVEQWQLERLKARTGTTHIAVQSD